jgi:hypothetical protein
VSAFVEIWFSLQYVSLLFPSPVDRVNTKFVKVAGLFAILSWHCSSRFSSLKSNFCALDCRVLRVAVLNLPCCSVCHEVFSLVHQVNIKIYLRVLRYEHIVYSWHFHCFVWQRVLQQEDGIVCMCLIKYRAVEAFGKVAVWFHAFITSTLKVCGSYTPWLFAPGERPPPQHPWHRKARLASRFGPDALE